MKILLDILELKEHELVSAKELHALCEVKQPFHLWFYQSVKGALQHENKDWVKIDGDYTLTKDTALHVAMIQNTRPANDLKIYMIERANRLHGPYGFFEKFGFPAKPE